MENEYMFHEDDEIISYNDEIISYNDEIISYNVDMLEDDSMFTEDDSMLDEDNFVDQMEHESINIYAEEEMFIPYPGPTWWGNTENEIDNIKKKLTESLEKWLVKVNIAPVSIKNEPWIYEARYEFRKYQKEFKYSKEVDDAISPETGKSSKDYLAFVDYVTGIGFGCIERMGTVGEVSTEIKIGDDGGGAVPEVVDELFSEKEEMDIPYNFLWLDQDDTKSLVDGLKNTQLKYHWWMRSLIPLKENKIKRPVPGEFVALVPFFFPNLPWGCQKKNPFVMAGNWMETLYYTNVEIDTVLKDGKYAVDYQGAKIEAISSDWAEYKNEDRVTILKDVETELETFTWDDMVDYEEEKWVIIPTIFYEKEQ